MSIWGKILGGAAGFAIGGPLGALLGAVAGHAVDLINGDETGGDATQSIAFTVGVIVLSAKMAKADGTVCHSEVAVFNRLFRVPPEELKNVGWLFDRAKKDALGFEPYARQIAKLLHDRPAVLEELLESLLRIAEADGHLHDAERAYLREVAVIFGIPDADFARVMAEHPAEGEPDPYMILGVARDAAAPDVKAAHRRLIREHHPDRLIAQGLPQEFIDVATEKLATINAAYDRIRRERGLN